MASPDLVDSIKKAAVEAVDASKPVSVLFGKVISINPLQITVEQKLTLGKEQLVLTRNVTDYSIDVSVQWETVTALKTHRHKIEAFSTLNAGDPSHAHAVEELFTEYSSSLAHIHNISGKKNMTVHSALKVGDEVLLLRMIGGQKFIVMDRVIA